MHLNRSFLILAFLFTTLFCTAQTDDGYDEILVTLNVQRIGNVEISAIIHDQVIYLPVKDVFDFLKIKIYPSPNNDSLSGYFIDPKATYLIDKINSKIIFSEKISLPERQEV